MLCRVVQQLASLTAELASQVSLIDKLNEQLEAEKNQTTDLTNKFHELELSEANSKKALESCTTEQQE
jgi:hypothetical protein